MQMIRPDIVYSICTRYYLFYRDSKLVLLPRWDDLLKC